MRTYKDLLHLLKKAVAHNRVYFQPPENLRMDYPAVIFHLSRNKTTHASDGRFKDNQEYTVILITEDPQPDALDAILNIPYSTLETTYVSNGMNHFVFTIYL